jgi:hypothetical protein
MWTSLYSRPVASVHNPYHRFWVFILYSYQLALNQTVIHIPSPQQLASETNRSPVLPILPKRIVPVEAVGLIRSSLRWRPVDVGGRNA